MAADHTDRGPDVRAPPPEKKPSLSIDRLTHADVPAVCGLYKRVADSQGPGLPVEIVKTWQPSPLEFTSRMEGITYFVARRDGRLVGAVGCESRHGSCHLLDLAVEPDARHQGVATALLGAAFEWAKRSNLPTVWADVLARYPIVPGLLKKLGFVEAGLLHRHEWAEDVRLFERVL